jgi:hypothetical protein
MFKNQSDGDRCNLIMNAIYLAAYVLIGGFMMYAYSHIKQASVQEIEDEL